MESVGRNDYETCVKAVSGLSLPTRGAWIEMPKSGIVQGGKQVAPHTGSVCRNKGIANTLESS